MPDSGYLGQVIDDWKQLSRICCNIILLQQTSLANAENPAQLMSLTLIYGVEKLYPINSQLGMKEVTVVVFYVIGNRGHGKRSEENFY